jgi:hypothetical protein
MDVYQNLKKQLQPTELYALSGDTLVDFELQSYAEGLGPAYDSLGELQAERFVATASDYGLEAMEQVYGLSSSVDLAQRRNSIFTLGAVTPNSVTGTDLEKTLSAFGLTVQIEENISVKKITVHFLKEPDCGRDRAKILLEIFCPAHLTAEPDYSSVS